MISDGRSPFRTSPNATLFTSTLACEANVYTVGMAWHGRVCARVLTGPYVRVAVTSARAVLIIRASPRPVFSVDDPVLYALE